MPVLNRLHPADRRKLLLDIKQMPAYKAVYRGQPAALVDALAEATNNGRKPITRAAFRTFLNKHRRRFFESARKVSHKDVWRIFEINRHTLMRTGTVEEIDAA